MGRGRSLAGDRGTAEDENSNDMIAQAPTMRCIACSAPTSRLQGVCRKCLAWHYRIDGLVRAQEILHACGGAAVLPAALDLTGVTR